MGCSVRFAGNPGRTKDRRIERLTINIGPRSAKPKKNPPVEFGGFDVCLYGVSCYPPHQEGTRRREPAGALATMMSYFVRDRRQQ
jgi:hypothetical protein